MRTGRFSVFSRIIVSLVFAVLASGLVSFGISDVIAAEKPARSEFKDPYNGGGIKLPNGGGEPGGAYMAFIKALYSKDHVRICKLIAEPAELELCLQQKQGLDMTIAMFTQPQSHKVLGGFMKGEEATLNVEYKHKGAPKNTGFVVMKKVKNRWELSSSGGSGSSNVSAEAGASTDMASGSTTVSDRAGESPEAEYTGPAYGKWTFTGDDDQGDTWTGTIDIGKLDPNRYDANKYHFHVVLEMKSSKTEERGIDAACAWEPGKREISCITEIGEYRAILSLDRKSLTLGTWNALEPEDWSTKKFKIIKIGGWTAAYMGGQADPGPSSASESTGAATTGADPEFAVINISANKQEYAGKCPASIAFTADITFKMPLPDKFSYRWELSNGKKTRDKVVKPPRKGHMSVREVWRGGKPGEQLDASVRFVAESGGAQMVLDPPGVKVNCK